MSAAVTFVTATYNKPVYLAEAAHSVFTQTRPDWEWWIVLNGPTMETEAVALRLADMNEKVKVFHHPATENRRRQVYYPSVIANQYYPKIETPFFTWLSDDDMLGPQFIEKLAGALEADRNKSVVWGHLEAVVQCDRGNLKRINDHILAQQPIGRDTGINPCGLIDSGQILQTKKSYDALGGYKIPVDWGSAYHHDGIYMNRLAKNFTFWPIDVKAVIHRRSALATFKKG
jgi:glycosyltransferase involved in cell wall biosynthesis